MEQTKAYKATDGKVFEDRVSCERHQKYLNFLDEYEQRKVYGQIEGCRIEAEDMWEWLQDNRNFVLDVLKK